MHTDIYKHRCTPYCVPESLMFGPRSLLHLVERNTKHTHLANGDRQNVCVASSQWKLSCSRCVSATALSDSITFAQVESVANQSHVISYWFMCHSQRYTLCANTLVPAEHYHYAWMVIERVVERQWNSFFFFLG